MPPSTWRQWREDQLALATSNTVVKGKGGDKGDKGGAKDGKDQASSSEADAMNQQIKATAQKICAMKKAGVPM